VGEVVVENGLGYDYDSIMYISRVSVT